MLKKIYISFFLLTREDELSTIDFLNFNQNTSTYEKNVNNENDKSKFRNIETFFELNSLITKIVFCYVSIEDFFRNKNQKKFNLQITLL